MNKFYTDFINFFSNNLSKNLNCKVDIGIPFFLNDEILSAEYIFKIDFFGGPSGSFLLLSPSQFFEQYYKEEKEFKRSIKDSLETENTKFANLELSEAHLFRDYVNADFLDNGESAIVYPLFVNSQKLLVVLNVRN